ncbi:unnamed protein product [Ectocarpus sp. 6 AP-2014]
MVLDRETAGTLKETEDEPLWSLPQQEDTVWRDRRLRTGVSDDAGASSRRQLQPTSGFCSISTRACEDCSEWSCGSDYVPKPAEADYPCPLGCTDTFCCNARALTCDSYVDAFGSTLCDEGYVPIDGGDTIECDTTCDSATCCQATDTPAPTSRPAVSTPAPTTASPTPPGTLTCESYVRAFGGSFCDEGSEPISGGDTIECGTTCNPETCCQGSVVVRVVRTVTCNLFVDASGGTLCDEGYVPIAGGNTIACDTACDVATCCQAIDTPTPTTVSTPAPTTASPTPGPTTDPTPSPTTASPTPGPTTDPTPSPTTGSPAPAGVLTCDSYVPPIGWGPLCQEGSDRIPGGDTIECGTTCDAATCCQAIGTVTCNLFVDASGGTLCDEGYVPIAGGNTIACDTACDVATCCQATDTPAPTAVSTPAPTTASPTPGPTTDPTPSPTTASPTPGPTTDPTPSPTTGSPAPVGTVTCDLFVDAPGGTLCDEGYVPIAGGNTIACDTACDVATCCQATDTPAPTAVSTLAPTTASPTPGPTTDPTPSPTTASPTPGPTADPTPSPTTASPTPGPTTDPTPSPTTASPTPGPTTDPTPSPTTGSPAPAGVLTCDSYVPPIGWGPLCQEGSDRIPGGDTIECGTTCDAATCCQAIGTVTCNLFVDASGGTLCDEGYVPIAGGNTIACDTACDVATCCQATDTPAPTAVSTPAPTTASPTPGEEQL